MFNQFTIIILVASLFILNVTCYNRGSILQRRLLSQPVAYQVVVGSTPAPGGDGDNDIKCDLGSLFGKLIGNVEELVKPGGELAGKIGSAIGVCPTVPPFDPKCVSPIIEAVTTGFKLIAPVLKLLEFGLQFLFKCLLGGGLFG
ncbi:uncharacterized protein LOC128965136 [Oppia nitens]|uniref:uncharacterized protein LOC128965136 n=1 Tax=Oppia nitens TaxID=1686743 RepID=UPI0023DB23F9|nr:uncharacterized protein LOC128965136 [Oppia nitens]